NEIWCPYADFGKSGDLKLSDIAVAAILAHEVFHVPQDRVGNPTARIPKYEYDALSAQEMLYLFLTGGIEVQAEIFEDAVREAELRRKIAKGFGKPPPSKYRLVLQYMKRL